MLRGPRVVGSFSDDDVIGSKVEPAPQPRPVSCEPTVNPGRPDRARNSAVIFDAEVNGEMDFMIVDPGCGKAPPPAGEFRRRRCASRQRRRRHRCFADQHAQGDYQDNARSDKHIGHPPAAGRFAHTCSGATILAAPRHVKTRFRAGSDSAVLRRERPVTLQSSTLLRNLQDSAMTRRLDGEKPHRRPAAPGSVKTAAAQASGTDCPLPSD